MNISKAACPIATSDIKVNIKNRQKAIDGAHYGPLNPEQPNALYWEGIAKRWHVTIPEAKKQRCGNCAAFIQTPEMLDCIDQGLGNEAGNDAWATIKAGDLGYCEAWDFKCAASRTCDAWVVGGPVTKDDGVEVMTPVQRVVTQQGKQWCVTSETGRSFGCYINEAAANERLAQIEHFAQTKTTTETTQKLIEWHDDFHKLEEVSLAHKMVHDIIEDEIEGRGIAQPYHLSTVDKVDLILKNTTAVVAKADEQRYTLGPWYVPGVEDAHGEFTDEQTLQLALWDWVRKGDRTVYLQHGEQPAGEMVEILTLPFPVEADLVVPGEGTTTYKFPSNTPFMGVVWEPWAWELVKAGKLRGYSIGGMAQRMEADLPDTALL